MTDTASELRTPFIDEERLEQRQQQRQVLLSIPKWLIDRVRIYAPDAPLDLPDDAPPPVTLAQRPLVEHYARSRIDDLLDQLQDDMVAVIDRGVAETVAAHLVTSLRQRPTRGAARWREDLADDLLIEIDIDEEALGELVDLLLLADTLADDGFSDLRFA